MSFQTGEKCWNTEVERVKSCELADKAELVVVLPSTLHRKVAALSESMDGKEWLGYLVGKEEPAGMFTVTQIDVPKQTVTSSHVDVDEPSLRKDVIGTLHSHHNMGAFFSGTDDEYIGANHVVMVVYSTKDGYKAQVKRELKCGAFVYRDAELRVTVPNPPDLAQFVTDAKKNISEYVYVPPVATQGGYPFYQRWIAGVGWGRNQDRTKLYCASCHKEIKGEILWIEDIMFCATCYQANTSALHGTGY